MAISHFAGHSGERIVFAHANGYPPGSYRSLLQALGEHCEVSAYEHTPLRLPSPPRANLRWRHFADDYRLHLQDQQAGFWLMGHSLGATVSMLACSPRLTGCKGLILLEPIFLPPRLAFATAFLPRRSKQKMPMVAKALRRPDSFSSHDEAFVFHRRARAFAGLSDSALMDYIHAGFEESSAGDVRLRFSKQWEAAVYMSTPWVWFTLRKIKLPTLGVVGQNSDVVSPAMLKHWQASQPQLSLHRVSGGHLFPMEHPELVSPLILDFIHSSC